MIVGIDLGTTKSVIGYWHQGAPRIAKSKNKESIPSEVYFMKNSVKIGFRPVGEESIFIGAIKRHLGKKKHIEIGGNKVVHPQVVAALILTKLKKMALEDMKSQGIEESIESAVIAIPSHFDIAQRRATLEAAKIAGLPVKRLINEATASALEYSRNCEITERILVFDLGGGTLDLSLIASPVSKENDDVLQVERIEGETSLGGLDFDEAILEWILKEVGTKNVVKLSKVNPTIRESLMKEISEKKIHLAQQSSVTINFPVGFMKGDLEILPAVKLTREVFLTLCEDLFTKITDLVGKTIADRKELYPVRMLLLGRAGRTYGLKERIQVEFPEFTISRRMNPETCVAKGAIMQAAIFEQKLKSHLVLEVLQDDYGIELDDSNFYTFLSKGKTIPCHATYEFETASDYQTKADLNVHKGISSYHNRVLMQTITIDAIPPAPKGTQKVKIKFDMNSNMMLKVTGNNKEFKIVSPNGLTKAEISKYRTFIGELYPLQPNSSS